MSIISEEIKNKLDIVDIIKDYIKIEKSGINYRALCPFHQEKTPSFFISQSKQIWHCFGSCSEGGDVFKFIMKIEGVEYIDALRILANRAGIILKKPDKETILRDSKKELLYNICESASLFFEKQLELEENKLVKNYLFDRGINQKSIKEWKVGYSPTSWQTLTDFLINKGYKLKEIEKTGLIIEKSKGGYFDRFRQRIIFPISDLNSRTIGFSGRIFDPEKKQLSEAKYINSPSTILYNKSEVLYGFNKAKLEIRKVDFCIIVEGYFDVIMLFQTDFKNVISISGTALTEHHLNIIKRHTKNIYLCFDTDNAGELATKKSIEMALSKDFNIQVIVLPKGLDPADVIQKISKKSDFQKYIDNSKSIIAYYFDKAFEKFNNETLKIEEKKEISKNLLPIIKKISNKIEESYWIQELSIKLNIRENILEEELKKIKDENFNFSTLVQNTKKNKNFLLEERILILVIKFNELTNLINLSFDYSPFFIKIINFIKKKENIKKIQEKIDSAEELSLLNYLLIKTENTSIEKNDAQEEIKLSLKALLKIELKRKNMAIIQKIKEAEKNSLQKEVEKLIKKLQKR